MQKLNLLLAGLALLVLSSNAYSQTSNPKITTIEQFIGAMETTLTDDEKEQLGTLFTELKAAVAKAKDGKSSKQLIIKIKQDQQKALQPNPKYDDIPQQRLDAIYKPPIDMLETSLKLVVRALQIYVWVESIRTLQHEMDGVILNDTALIVSVIQATLSNQQLENLGGFFTELKTLAATAAAKTEQMVTADTEQAKQTSNSVGMTFVHIPAGSFQMGDIQGGGYSYEQPVHTVTIAQPFYMAKTEVTQAQWQAVMSNNPSRFKGDDRPVENVSWDDIQAFINKLNQQTSKTHRLPTEAEWEYAARAGSTTKYSWGNDIGSNQANCSGCGSQWDGEQTAPVASFAPNAFGLYDMHGNVYEWVQDCRNDNYNNAPTDGSTWLAGNCAMRVLRGGSWSYTPRWLRSASRDGSDASDRYYFIGFRLIQDRNP